MKSIFPDSFFSGNRTALLKQVKADLVVMVAHGVLQRNGSVTYPFRQESNFWYLTGIDEPDVTLVIEAGEPWLIVPRRDAVVEYFEGAINTELLTQTSAITTVLDEKAGNERLIKSLGKAKRIASLSSLPAYIERAGFYTNPAQARLDKLVKKHAPKAKRIDLRPVLRSLRTVKQPLELTVIQKAVDITSQTLQEVLARSYSHEYELEAAITEGFRRRGADGHAYEPIVASGKNACTLHYTENNAPIDKHGLLLVDVGAEVDHYAADITRTIAPVIATPRQQAVFNAVLDVQEWAKQQLKPGVLVKEYETAVEKYLGEQLKKLKLIKTNSRKNVREFYPQLTSHHLGLDTHDAADYERPLQAGMVLTVEPAIYIPNEGIGVRIEDDVLITEHGIKVLSDNLPRVLA